MGRRKEVSSKPATADESWPPTRETQTAAPPPASPRGTMAEAIARVHGGRVVSRDDRNGVVRMKIVVSKQQLRQMVLSIGPPSSSSSPPPPQQALEQLLHLLRRRHMKRPGDAGKAHRTTPWRPALQSIPEEM